MKAILITIKPEWCAKIMNGDKDIEVRTSDALAKAINSLIREYGKTVVYVACSKNGKKLAYNSATKFAFIEDKNEYYDTQHLQECNGKVAFKFECRKVEDIVVDEGWIDEFTDTNIPTTFTTETCCTDEILERTCLTEDELFDYSDEYSKNLYAIHIDKLQVFDKPLAPLEFCNKLIEDFKKKNEQTNYSLGVPSIGYIRNMEKLTRLPQNFCYIEVEE